MAIRANHYDAAFEEFLRAGRIPYLAMNEARRALWRDVSLKSLDFVVYSPQWGNLLIDVKGRRATREDGQRPHWENWATADDLTSMEHWESIFGTTFRAMLVFAYWLPDQSNDTGPVEPWAGMQPMLLFRGRNYGFYGVWASDYRQQMRVRSPKWDTVWLPSRPFRELRFPLAEAAPVATVT